MLLIRVPDDVVNKLIDIANSQQRSFSNYLSEILEQAVRADELDCSLKMIVDFYEFKTMQKEEIEMEERTEDTEQLEEPSIDKVFERMLESKLRSQSTEKIRELEEARKRVSAFLSELSRKA